MTTNKESRVNILGVGVSAISLDEAVKRTDIFLSSGAQGYICVTGVHGIMEAQADNDFRRILNRSFLTTPDGMPTVWLGKASGFKSMTRVYGPDYMVAVCGGSVAVKRTTENGQRRSGCVSIQAEHFLIERHQLRR